MMPSPAKMSSGWIDDLKRDIDDQLNKLTLSKAEDI